MTEVVAIVYPPHILTRLAERVTFFFSDSNFRSDAFMLKESASNDGYIEISSLLKFNSIRKISNDPLALSAAAQTVATVVVSKDGEAIRRKEPLPEKSDAAAFSIYIGGMPTHATEVGGEAAVTADADGEKKAVEAAASPEKAVDANAGDSTGNPTPSKAPAPSTTITTATTTTASTAKTADAEEDADAEETLAIETLTKGKPNGDLRYDHTVDAVRDIFSKYGEIAIVRFRFSKSDKIKGTRKQALGSIFVEFATKESVKAVMDAVAAEEKFTIGEKQIYPKEMELWLTEQKAKAANRSNAKGNKKGGDAKDKDTKEEKAPAVEEVKPLEIEKIEWKPSCVITLSSLPEGCDREMLKAAFDSAGVTIDYMDYSRGESTGAVRVNETSDKFKECPAKLNSGEIKVGEATISDAKLLEGEEEEKYWLDSAKAKAERKRAREGENRKGGNKNFGNKRQKGNRR